MLNNKTIEVLLKILEEASDMVEAWPLDESAPVFAGKCVVATDSELGVGALS